MNLSYLALAISGSAEGGGALLMLGAIITIVFTLLGLIILPGLIIAALSRRRIEKYLNHKVSTVITQYDPPHNLLPAEMGLLYDMIVTKEDVAATLFHLEQRGVITINSESNVTITDQVAFDALPQFEQIAVRITNDINAVQAVSFQLSNGQVANIQIPARQGLSAFSTAVQQNLLSKGIKTNNFTSAFALRVIGVALLVALLPMLMASSGWTVNDIKYDAWSVVAFQQAFGMVQFFGFFLWPVYIVFGIIIVHIWTRIAGRYWLNTRQARALWPEIEGYRIFLKQTDVDNIAFESLHDHDPVTKSLPYAIIFNFETKWQARLRKRIAQK